MKRRTDPCPVLRAVALATILCTLPAPRRAGSETLGRPASPRAAGNPSDESPSTSGGRDVEVEVRIRQYLLSTFPFDDPASLGPDTRLLGGPIDSLGLMQLVAFVEDEFGVVFDYE